jgi:hypothetical protein
VHGLLTLLYVKHLFPDYMRILYVVFSLALAVSVSESCKSPKSKEATAAALQGDTAVQSVSGGKVPLMVNVPVDEIKPPSASRKSFLTTGWWHFNMALHPGDSLIHLNYQHKWLKFREDQTFDVLIKNRVVDTGRWNFDDQNNIIYLSCKDPYINNTWSVLEKGFVMIWIGNTAVNTTGTQIRVANYRTAPPSE